MNWLRYVLLAVCILSALAGYRKGLVRTVLSMVSLILVTGLAIWMNPYVTDVLNERTTLPQYVEKKCLETFENNEFLSGENQDVQKKWLESMGVPGEAGEPDPRKRRGAGVPGDSSQVWHPSGEGGIGKDYERNRFLSDTGAGRWFRDDCGENCENDCWRFRGSAF